MSILTYERLKSLNPCADQLKLFRDTFGASVVITEALCLEHASRFDWGWAAHNLLSAQALAEYRRVTTHAWAEYERVKAPAWAEYERVSAQACAEYDRVSAQACAEYDRVTAQAWALLFIAENAA